MKINFRIFGVIVAFIVLCSFTMSFAKDYLLKITSTNTPVLNVMEPESRC